MNKKIIFTVLTVSLLISSCIPDQGSAPNSVIGEWEVQDVISQNAEQDLVAFLFSVGGDAKSMIFTAHEINVLDKNGDLSESAHYKTNKDVITLSKEEEEVQFDLTFKDNLVVLSNSELKFILKRK